MGNCIKDLIYDIGMHQGNDTAFYLAKGFRVIAIEAVPELVKYAQSRFRKEIDTGRLVIVNKAISKQKGTIDFYVNKYKDDWGSVYKGWNDTQNDETEKIMVESIDLSTILDQYGVPYYMKIDIEGADIHCLESLVGYPVKPKFISVELLPYPNNSCMNGSCTDVLSYLHVLGYTRFAVSNQYRNTHTKCPYPAREGDYLGFADFLDILN